MGCCTTSLVRTASRLTRLRARRIRDDARSRWQSNGRRKKRRADYKTNRDPAEHLLIDSMPIAPRPAGSVTETAIAAADVQSTTGKAL
jgi:hypothetical protein